MDFVNLLLDSVDSLSQDATIVAADSTCIYTLPSCRASTVVHSVLFLLLGGAMEGLVSEIHLIVEGVTQSLFERIHCNYE
jgi:hypothetical protein